MGPGWLKWATAAAVFAAGAYFAQAELARVPPPVLDVNLLFVPPPALTAAMATGNENLVADGLWLGLLQYYGDRLVMDNRHAVNLAAMFNLITDLDQRFWSAYWLGAWALADNDEPEEALKLLEKGERLNPDDYNYPYTQGFIQFLYRKDYGAAARCFEATSRHSGAPRFARAMAARMYLKEGQRDLALSIWQALFDKAPDGATREIARKNLAQLRR